MFKYFALALDYALAICYQLVKEELSLVILLPPLLHTLTFCVKPHCYANHCHPSHAPKEPPFQSPNEWGSPVKVDGPVASVSESPSPAPFEQWSGRKEKESGRKGRPVEIEYEYQECKECGLAKWVRMHHCYYCKVCVHKYDHHCILLGVCIGEANQKYYLPYLWLFLYSSVVQALGYYGLVGGHLRVDERGYEHVEWAYVGMSLAIIFFAMAVVIVGYLAFYHSYLALHNDTTYEMRKRPEIYYFRGVVKEHPFDQGVLQNLRLLAGASAGSPTEWRRPERAVVRGLQEANIFEEGERGGRRSPRIQYHHINLNNIKL